MIMTSKELIRLLKRNGYSEIYCGNGSHRKLQNSKTKNVVIVPYHTKDLSIGLIKAILKQTGIGEKNVNN